MTRAIPRRPILPLALAALSGVALGPLLPAALAWALVWLAAPALLLALRAGPGPAPSLAVALLLGAAGGLFGLRAAGAEAACRALREAPPPPAGPHELLVRLVEAPHAEPGRARLLVEAPGAAGASWLEVDAPPAAARLLTGARLRLEGTYHTELAAPRRERLARQGIAARFRATSLDLEAPARGPLAVLAAVEQGARRLIARSADPARAPFLRTVLLGDRARLDPVHAAAFRDTGAAHLLSISGLHVGLVAGLALALAGAFGLPRHERRLAAAAAILLYTAIAGAKVAVLRSALAGLVLCAGPARGDAWNRLALGLCLVLLWDPLSPWDLDLQLSFGVTAGLLLLGPLVARVARGPAHATPGAAPAQPPRSAWARVTAAHVTLPFLASVPLVWACLGQLSPVSLLANAAAVPLCALVLGLGLLGILADPLLPALGHELLRAADQVTRALFALVEGSARLPGARLDLVRPSPWVAVLAGGLVALGAARRERGRPAGLLFALAGLLGLSALVPAATAERTALDPTRGGAARLLVHPAGGAALLAGEGPTALALGRLRLDGWRDQALRRLGCAQLSAPPAEETQVLPGVWCEQRGRAYVLRDAPSAAGGRVTLLFAPLPLSAGEARRLRRELAPARALQPAGRAAPQPGWEVVAGELELRLPLAPAR